MPRQSSTSVRGAPLRPAQNPPPYRPVTSVSWLGEPESPSSCLFGLLQSAPIVTLKFMTATQQTRALELPRNSYPIAVLSALEFQVVKLVVPHLHTGP
ncbi:hypothetical protein N7540_010816 [Penicillium herquei]|nr:hypothetical protein N7540_010816 [Penicillium herquei]